MTDTSAAPTAARSPWTCPFCPLACDHLDVGVGAGNAPLVLQGGTCARASHALAHFTAQPSGAGPEIDGRPCGLDGGPCGNAGLWADTGAGAPFASQ